MLERVPYSRLVLLFFGYLSRGVEEQFESIKRGLHGARMATTYHGYLARTMIYAIGVFLFTLSLLVGLSVVLIRPAALASFDRLMLSGGFVFPSVVAGYAVYRARLYYPKYVADERGRAIELSMPNVVNFMLALSRAGVPTADALRVISAHADVLGEAAEELQYAYRDMEYFGADVVAALNRLSETTALDELSEFIDGYVRVLTGRGDVDRYLESEVEDLFDKAELEQEEFLSRLGVMAEVYVAVFVALPIFALIILMVMGFIGSDVLTGIRVVVYAVVPLSAVGFLVLLDITMSSPLSGAGSHEELETVDLYEQSLWRIPTADREYSEQNVKRLERYQLRRRLSEFVAAPVTLMRRQPEYALAVGIAAAVLYLVLKVAIGVAAPGVPFVAPIPPDASILEVVQAVDDAVVEAIMLSLLVYGVFYELRARYLADVERVLPEFLSELAQRHEIGMSLSGSIEDLGVRDMGRLNDEIDRMIRDLAIGSAATDVLGRFANRMRSSVITRVVVLLTASSDTAEQLGPVIEALADRAALAQRLKRERQIEMSLYVVIIYISFMVFLVILAILNDVFLPQVPDGGFGIGGFETSDFDPIQYQTLFYHATVLQAMFGGLVGGKMSEGRVSAGVKHALVMLVIAYVVFVVILPNVQIQLA